MGQQLRETEDMDYAGDVTVSTCWSALIQQPNAVLLDVRTQAEWQFTGTADLSSLNKKTRLISWRHYPQMQLNPQFVTEVEKHLRNKNTPIYCICKTGGRSAEAALALTQAGYTACFNVIDGYEGDRNTRGQRGQINGWKASHLPWEQH